MTADDPRAVADYPIRQKSAQGEPKPFSQITRRCGRCGACFLGLRPGKTGERGLWTDMRWYCSQECHDERQAGTP